MNPDLDKLHAYPFQKLAKLFQGTQPPADLKPIPLSIGEPKHPSPQLVKDVLAASLDLLAKYPTTKGTDDLRNAIADWLNSRFKLGDQGIHPQSQVLPVNGTREALFAFAQAVVDRNAGHGDASPVVAMPNPFYQIYEGAALLAGATPHFLNTTADNGFLVDTDAVPTEIWDRCQLLYLCSPGNPTGAVTGIEELKKLIALADQHDFIIASDECYSELYPDENNPPAGLLQACAELGRDDYHRCVVFHSLSKRSNLPGLRSGFVAGDAYVLEKFFLFRTYHGCAMSPHHQQASIAAWRDESHVVENRQLYREKFEAVLEILSPVLDVSAPDAGFYLWAKTPITDTVTSDTEFALDLYDRTHVTVLPGSYLSREADGINPGSGRVRMALVAPLDECVEAAKRIRQFVESL